MKLSWGVGGGVHTASSCVAVLPTLCRTTLFTWLPGSAAPKVVKPDMGAQTHRAPQKAELVDGNRKNSVNVSLPFLNMSWKDTESLVSTQRDKINF